MDFITQYFIDPIYSGEGYNTVNTVVYGLVLGVGIIALEELVIKLKVKIDRNFLYGILPYLVLGATLRSLVDAKLLPRTAFLITPGIFFTMTAVALVVLILSIGLQKRNAIPYHRTMGIIGLFLLPLPLYVALTNIIAPQAFPYIAGLFVLSSGILYLAMKRVPSLDDPWIIGVMVGHMLDASATVTGVEYFGYFEEHVFENWLILLVGTAYILYPLKIIALLAVIYAVKRWVDEENFWWFAFFALGFAPGLRDTLTILLLG